MNNSTFNFQKTANKEKKTNTGVMIAFFIPSQIAKKIALKKEDYPEDYNVQDKADLHITLAYLGKAVDIESKKEQVIEVVKNFAKKEEKIKGNISGVGRFNVEDEPHPFYASFDSGKLPKFRERLIDALSAIGIETASNHGFTPHITILYMPKDEKMPDIQVPMVELEFDKITLAWAGKNETFNL